MLSFHSQILINMHTFSWRVKFLQSALTESHFFHQLQPPLHPKPTLRSIFSTMEMEKVVRGKKDDGCSFKYSDAIAVLT